MRCLLARVAILIPSIGFQPAWAARLRETSAHDERTRQDFLDTEKRDSSLHAATSSPSGRGASLAVGRSGAEQSQDELKDLSVRGPHVAFNAGCEDAHSSLS